MEFIFNGLGSIIIACVVVKTTGDIIRDDDGGMEGEFSIVTSGRRYTNVLLFVEGVNLQGCLVSCLQHIQCNNINYNEQQRYCDVCADNVDGSKGDPNAVGWWSYGTPQKVDGGWGIWRQDGECSQTCDVGIQKERRECSNPTPQYGGKVCEGESNRITSCMLKPCPVDGRYGQWSSYGSCSKTCGSGEQKRTRLCDAPTPMHGGKNCTELGDPTEAKSCYERPCPSVDGGYGQWSSYTKCTENCGGTGTQTRIRKCDTPTPMHGGKDCTSLGKPTDTRTCNTNKCPDKCPLLDAIVKGVALYDKPGVSSWVYCSAVCDIEPKCKFWVWRTGEMCHLKKTKTHMVLEQTGFTSGKRGCRAFIGNIPLVNPIQSSSDDGGKHPATKALDDGIYITPHTGCAVTKVEKDPWWRAELAMSYFITTIQIMRRMGACAQCKYPHVKVETSVDGNIWTLCEDLGNKLDGATDWVDATCPDRAQGQHIKITLIGYLNLSVCEVKAWGYAGISVDDPLIVG